MQRLGYLQRPATAHRQWRRRRAQTQPSGGHRSLGTAEQHQVLQDVATKKVEIPTANTQCRTTVGAEHRGLGGRPGIKSLLAGGGGSIGPAEGEV